MKRAWLTVALLVSLGVNLGLVGVGVARRVASHRWERIESGDERPPADLGRRLAERIGVPEERRQRFQEIQRKLIEQTARERREVGRLRLEIRDELMSPQPDSGRLDDLLRQLAEREAQLNRAFVDSVVESRGVLDDEEMRLYLNFLERMGPGQRGPRGPRSDGPRRFERRPLERDRP